MLNGLKEIKLPLKSVKRGKVREIYEFESQFLILCTDRISAFDVVMNEPIPDKGRVLNLLSTHFFNLSNKIIKNHLVSTEIPDILKKYTEQIQDRIMIVEKAKPLKVECVVRGYLAGSVWSEYKEKKTVFGKKIVDMLEADKFEAPIFTPTTKAESGHDLPLDYDAVVNMVGADLAKELKETSIKLYSWGRDHLEKKGVIIADTKFEFGLIDDKLILIDEIFTPDSSRFWLKADYKPGKHIDPLDKQYLRDYLISIGWNRSPPPPTLPDQVIKMTRERYLRVYHLITGQNIDNN